MENENTTNTTTATEPQGGPSKFCAACGARLHMLAEICPKCGVRQAPPPHAAQGPAANVAQQAGAFFNEMTREMRSMGFLAWLKKMTTSNGRASRKEFIAVAILPMILLLLFSFVGGFVGTHLGIELLTIELVTIIAWSPFGIFCFYGMVRRLHDMNMTGLFVILIGILIFILQEALSDIYIVPLVVMIVLAAIPGTAGSNKYGEPPK